MTSCIGVLMLHITFSKYDCIIVHKAFYLFTCTYVSINSFHSHSHSHSHIWIFDFFRGGGSAYACSLAGGHALDPLSLWGMINCITTNIISVTEYFFFLERSITRHKTRCIMLKNICEPL